MKKHMGGVQKHRGLRIIHSMVMISTRPFRIWARVFSRRTWSHWSCARAWLASSSKDSSKRMAFLNIFSALRAAKKADACLCLAALRRAFRVQIHGLLKVELESMAGCFKGCTVTPPHPWAMAAGVEEFDVNFES